MKRLQEKQAKEKQNWTNTPNKRDMKIDECLLQIKFQAYNKIDVEHLRIDILCKTSEKLIFVDKQPHHTNSLSVSLPLFRSIQYGLSLIEHLFFFPDYRRKMLSQLLFFFL